MVKKPTAPKSSGADAPTGHRLNRAKILDDIRKNKSYRGGSGSDRKALFLKNSDLPAQLWVLPDIRPRGPVNDPLPYFEVAPHWLQMKTKEGKEYPRGVTCFEHLADTEPGAYQRFLNEKLIKDEKCPVCEVLGRFDEKEFPPGLYGKPKIAAQPKWFFQVLREELASRGDDHPIKVYGANQTGRSNFMALVGNEDVAGAAKFETEGMFTAWEKEEKSTRVIPLTPRKIWLKEWQKKLLDLEIITPVFMEREEIIQVLAENLPQFPVLKIFNLNGAPVKAKPVEPKKKVPTPKKAVKT